MMHVLSHPLLIDQQTLPTKRRQNLGLSTIAVSYDPAGGDGLEALAPRYMADSVPLKSLLVPTVVIPIANYAMLAFLDISLRALFPLIFSTPIYLGGLGFAPVSIGSWLALFGIVDGVFQALFFAKMVDWLGPKRLFCVSVSCFAPVMAVFPIISWLASARGMVDHAITFTLLGQLVLIVLWDMSFGECFNKIGSVITSNPLNYRDYFPVYHSLCSFTECPWGYQRSWSNIRSHGSCLWACVSDISICIFKRTQYSQWERDIRRLHYIGWWIEMAGIAVTRQIT
jgi:hypothetical protein